jgi:hypothetical protein
VLERLEELAVPLDALGVVAAYLNKRGEPRGREMEGLAYDDDFGDDPRGTGCR